MIMNLTILTIIQMYSNYTNYTNYTNLDICILQSKCNSHYHYSYHTNIHEVKPNPFINIILYGLLFQLFSVFILLCFAYLECCHPKTY